MCLWETEESETSKWDMHVIFWAIFWILLQLLQEMLDKCPGSVSLIPTTKTGSQGCSHACLCVPYFSSRWCCRFGISYRQMPVSGFHSKTGGASPDVPLPSAEHTHLVSRTGLITVPLKWAIQHTLDLVIILYLALLSLSLSCMFPDFPFPHYLNRDKSRVCLQPNPNHTVSFVYERSLVGFFLQSVSSYDLLQLFGV